MKSVKNKKRERKAEAQAISDKDILREWGHVVRDPSQPP